MYFSDNEQLKNGKQRRKQMTMALFTTHSITYAGSVGQKQHPAYSNFKVAGKLIGGVRTGHTVKRYKQGPKTETTPQISL